LRSSSSPLTRDALKVGEALDRVIEEVRLLSHGLNPVDVDRWGLSVAMQQLATRTANLYRVECEFHGHGRVEIEDRFAAEHLYRIAQEAVTNAVKHGHPQRIDVTLQADDNRLTLQIIDNGIGIQARDLAGSGAGPYARLGTGTGSGLRNMHYRAGLIGADLRIEPGDNNVGTRVRCIYRAERTG